MINENIDEIRRNLGVCPQHDVLFPDLTVQEHLVMFAAFKGVSQGNIADDGENGASSWAYGEAQHLLEGAFRRAKKEAFCRHCLYWRVASSVPRRAYKRYGPVLSPLHVECDSPIS